MKFKKGDKVIVKSSFVEHLNKWRYKRGIFSHYSKTGKFGFFKNLSTGKVLKRKAEEFIPAN